MTAASQNPQPAITRHQLHAFTMAGLLANGYLGEMVSRAGRFGLAESLLAGFGISVIEVAAVYIVISLLDRARAASDAPAGRADLLACGAAFIIMLFPEHRASWLGATLFATFVVWRTRQPLLRSAAGVMLSLSVAKLWGKLLLLLFAAPLVRLDTFATYLLALHFDEHVVVAGNILTTGDGHSLAIMRGCSSVSNMSQALLAWIALPRLVRPEITIGDLAWAPLVAAAVMLINILRMGLMLVAPSWYVVVHDGAGATAINVLTLLVVGTLCYLRVRHVL